MAALDDESAFGAKPKPRLAHEIGQNIDDLSAPELTERIALLRSEIDRLEKAIERVKRRARPPPRSSKSEPSRSILAALRSP